MTGVNKNIFTKKALIFDMDGTVVNNISYHNHARLIFLEKYGVILQPGELNNIKKDSTKELVKRFIGANLSALEIRKLDKEKQAIYRNLYKGHVNEIKGFKRLLYSAKSNGLSIALVTMGCWENIDLVINSLGVRYYFDVIVSGDEVKRGKPYPDIYELALSQLSICSKDAIVFEDTLNGVISAQKAGISVIGVTSSHSEKEFNSWGVDLCVKDFDEYIQTLLPEKNEKFYTEYAEH
jgi:HAD superfamily hydrolase (TIGR01509 family)